jgi:3-deoxy-manno-octulosonate cytidylyltransferase (CMP-KDO synthetase)
MSFTVVIPARHGSSRLPGKPLMDIGGMPMIQHVYNRARESSARRVVIATDDERIRDVCAFFSAEVVMTAADHVSGTDRLEEVVQKLGFSDEECVVNVQGDEPLIPPALINQVAQNLMARPDTDIATLSETIPEVDQLFNPNVVKVVCDKKGFALYFSRAPIPWARDTWSRGDSRPDRLPVGHAYARHIGLYGYRVGLLRNFVGWPPSPLETMESLEQLRALENGARIHVETACTTPPAGVDTPEDLNRLRALFSDARASGNATLSSTEGNQP